MGECGENNLFVKPNELAQSREDLSDAMARKGRMKSNYWCPVNLYGRPYKRRVLGKRIEGVVSDGMPWKKNPPPWKKVPTAACFYGAPPRRK